MWLFAALFAAAPATPGPGVAAWVLPPPRTVVLPALRATGVRGHGRHACAHRWGRSGSLPRQRAGEGGSACTPAADTACSLAGPAADGMQSSEVRALWDQLPAELQRGLRFVDVLGEGCFGVVVLAEKQRGAADAPGLWADNCDVTGQQLRCDDGSAQVAVKLVRPRPGEEALAMREGLVLSTIQSRASSPECVHMTKCLDYGMCDNGLVYTVIDFVPGEPLDQVLKREGPLPAREVARVGSHICEALSVIHRAGFNYGDLKTQNIMRSTTDNGETIYRLIDFGSTMGLSGCLFGSDHDAAAAAADLSPAALASFIVSDATSESLNGGGSCLLVEEDEERLERMVDTYRALTSRGAPAIGSHSQGVEGTPQQLPPAENLPEHWRAAVDQETGRIYYLNDASKVTQWERPLTPAEKAKQEEEIEREVLTWFAALVRQQDEVSGTPAYMAPEQMLQSRALITPQTDIYNLGAVLFYLASQRLPVPAATAQVRCTKHICHKPRNGRGLTKARLSLLRILICQLPKP